MAILAIIPESMMGGTAIPEEEAQEPAEMQQADTQAGAIPESMEIE